jgi:4-methyl-5(b-hydroxyethyl)-thiazole monophosphate biosynthesis
MVYMLLGTGFEETEAIAPLDLLRRANVQVLTVGVNGKTVYGSHGIGIEADITLEQMDLTDLEMIVLPGGLGGVASIRGCQKALEAVKAVYEMDKYVAAICAGPTVLADLGLLTGVQATCYPGQIPNMKDALVVPDAACVTDGKVITGASAGTAVPFALALIEALKGPEAAKVIADQIVIR